MADDDAQQVLDELAGRMSSSQVRDPVRYCARLVERFKRGAFRLELGQAVEKRRHDERQRHALPTTQSSAKLAATDRAIGGLSVHIREALERLRPARESGQQDNGSEERSAPSNRTSNGSA
jgi:hypothetical protein